MTIELPKDIEERARAKVDSGEYPDVAAVVRAGLEALDVLNEPEDDEWSANARKVFEEGRAAIARGEGFQGSPQDVVERARARVDKRIKSA